MRIIWDCSILNMYPVMKPGFRGGTETMIVEICKRLASKGHTVHVVCRDAEQDATIDGVYYWPTTYHPVKADVLIETQQLIPHHMEQYEANLVVLAHTGCDPYLGPDNMFLANIDAWPVFCDTHKEMLLEQRPSIPAEKIFVTGLGVQLEDYPHKELGGFAPGIGWYGIEYGRLLYANDPMRGLFYLLDIFDIVKQQVPDASLHVAYDFDRQFKVHEWEHTYKAQLMHETKYRVLNTPGVVNLGNISREQLIQEQLECQVHCMPSDPPNLGTQTWGITQMECAAAGSALVLSSIEAFPEVFGDAAVILPVIGHYMDDQQRRVDASDYAAVVVELMQDGIKWQAASRKSRALAEQHTWDACADKWESMLVSLLKETIHVL